MLCVHTSQATEQTASSDSGTAMAKARLRARSSTGLEGSAEQFGESLRRRRESVSSSSGSESDGSVTPPAAEHSWLVLVECPGGEPTPMVVSPDLPLSQSVSASLLLGGKHLLYDGGAELSLDRTPREDGLVNGDVLQLFQPQCGGGPGGSAADADVEMDYAGECSDDDDALSPEELGRRMFERGEPPPSPNPSNEAIRCAYNAAAEAASAAAASAGGAAVSSSAAANGPAAVASDGESEPDASDDDLVFGGGADPGPSSGPQCCAVCRTALPVSFAPFDNGIPPVCCGGDC